MNPPQELWRPACTLETARRRSEIIQQIRRFFAKNSVLEVETPILSQFAATDIQLQQWQTQEGYRLHTSPEFPMKRLLAAGFGDIFQICKVFRQDELGQRHNPEFTMLEWYRMGFDEFRLMQEVINLIQNLAGDKPLKSKQLTYAQAFEQCSLPNPHTASLELLQAIVAQQLNADSKQWQRDECLDALMSMIVEPALPKDRLCFVYDYPASQAALAEIHEYEGVQLGRRFELYWQGMELANGYFELTDYAEQKSRFLADLKLQDTLKEQQLDHHFLSALKVGLPQCSGVALGVDRLLMVLLVKESIDEVITFPFNRA